MSITAILILLLIAAICGAAGQALAGYSLGGCLASIGIGFLGALLGMWLAGALGLPEFWTIEVGGESFPVIWSIIGSMILALVFGMIRRRGS